MATKTKPKAKKPNARGRKKGQQTHLPDMGPEKNTTIHPLALEYVRVRDDRMDLTKEEVKLADRLIDAMKAEGITAYEYDDVNVVLDATLKVKVKKAGKNGDGK